MKKKANTKKSLLFLFLLIQGAAQAEYIDINQDTKIVTNFRANGFNIYADDNDIGLGLGYQKENTELTAGIIENGYYGNVHFTVPQTRYQLDTFYKRKNETSETMMGITYYLSENFGVRIAHQFENGQYFLSVRKWI